MIHATKGSLRRSLAVMAATFVVAALVAGGSEPDDEASERMIRGKTLYQIYCQNCHGESGRGDGPTAKLLKVRPTDLTRLSRGNNGEFPGDQLRRTIDGRNEVRGHGAQQMPIWGLAFQEYDKDVNQEAEVQARIEQLLEYLESIQR